MRSVPVALCLVLGSAVAHAHPLGNFTVNRYAALRLEPRTITIRYVVDMAEIPTFQELRVVDANGDQTIDEREQDAYVRRMATELGRNLALGIDGRTLGLTPGAHAFETLPGAGGLPTLRLELWYSTLLGADRGAVAFRDANFAGRPGWQEMIADGGAGMVLSESTVPRVDRSQALRAYPEDQLQSPPQVTEARFRFSPGAAVPAAERVVSPARAGAARFADRMTELVATRAPLGPWLVLTSLLVAAGLGALHALSPGHGKTVVGAYLVGARGTARHAVFLGLVVTATHTLGVYALGLLTLTASAYVVPERLFPWISAVSGLVVVAVGASLAASRLQAALALGHDGHPHAHDDHHHDGHAHTHDHDHSHSHPPADGAIGWRSLLALGVSGGLLPCPSALVVMLGAIAFGRIAFGLLLIVAFSAGLAAVLTSIGIALVYARDLFERLPLDGRLARFAPVASALVISIAGLAIVIEAIARLGI